MEHKYSLNIFWSDEDGCFVATIPEFPNLSAFGGTAEKAAKDAKLVLAMALESLARDGIPAPEPQKHLPQEYSGQVRLRMPKTLHAELAQTAEQEGVSLNTHMISLLSKNNSAMLVKDEIIHEMKKHFKHQDQKFDTLHRSIGDKQKEKDMPGWNFDAWGKIDSIYQNTVKEAN